MNDSIRYHMMTLNSHQASSVEAGNPLPEQAAGANFRVDFPVVAHFVPRWPTNPYHAELSRHLLEWGVRVEEESRLKTITKQSNVREKRPDIIHIHAISRFELSLLQGLRFVMFWLRLCRLRIRGIRLVMTIHDGSHHEAHCPFIDLTFSRIFYRLADAIIVHSKAAGKAVEQQWNVRRDANVYVIPHGNYIGCYPNSISRREARKKLRLPADKTVFLFLGLIRPYKGVHNLIEAFKVLRDNNIQLVIAGKPISEELSSSISSAIGDSANIQYCPSYICDDEVQDYMNAADAVVFPYTKALTSGALILAMSFGRACIAPKMGALADTLDEGGGFLYDPSAAGGLLDAMERAVRERSRLEDMGEHNKRKAEGWNWNDVARMTADVYRQCLSGR